MLRGFGYLLLLLLAAATVVGLPRWLFLSGHDFFAVWLTHEDGPYEAFGALGCLAAAIVLGYVGLKRQPGATLETRGARGWPTLLLSAALLLMFLEEISWGQRIFSLTVPDWLKRANIQEEWTLHNLRVFHPSLSENHLKVAWLYASVIYLGICPIIAAVCAPLRRLAAAWRVPLASWQLGLAVFLAYVLYGRILNATLGEADLFAAHDVGEAIELAFEAAYLILASEVFLDYRKGPERRDNRSLAWFMLATVAPLFLLMTWGLAAALAPADPHLMAVACLRRGNVRFTEQDFDQAANSYAESLQHWPDQVTPHLRIAYIAVNRRDVKTAGEHYRLALAQQPGNIDALTGLGVVLNAEGNPAQALIQFQKAVELDPKNISALNNLGVLCAQQRQWNESEECFSKVLVLKPDDPEAQRNLESVRRAKAGQN